MILGVLLTPTRYPFQANDFSEVSRNDGMIDTVRTECSAKGGMSSITYYPDASAVHETRPTASECLLLLPSAPSMSSDVFIQWMVAHVIRCYLGCLRTH